MVNRKFSYPKNGMTPEAVSARKQELAVWLREGCVRWGCACDQNTSSRYTHHHNDNGTIIIRTIAPSHQYQ